MSTLTMRALRLVVLLSLLGGSLAAAGPTRAQELDGNEYTDEEYGWSVAFDEDVWTGEEVDEPTYRGLNLSFESGFGTLAVYDNGETDPAACLEATAEDFAGSEVFLDFTPSRSFDAPETDRDAEGDVFDTTYTSDDTEIPLVFYIECREVDGGTLNVQLASDAEVYEDTLPDFEDLLAAIEIEVGGSSTRDDTPEPDDEETPEADETPDRGDPEIVDGLEGDTYGDADHAWQVTFDDRVWEAEEAESARDAALTYTGLSLSTDGAVASLFVYDDGIEDAADCLADLDRSFSGSDGWEDLAPARRLDAPATDRTAEAALYTGALILDDGDVDAVLYLECREVEDATLAITVTVAETSYEDLLPDLEALLSGIDSSGLTSGADDEETPESGGTVENDIEAGEVDGDTFTDTALNYSVTWDDRVWAGELLESDLTTGVFLATDDEELFATVTIDASLGYDGVDVEQCVADIAAGYEGFDGYSDLDEVRNPDGPESPRDGASGVYAFIFTYEDDTEADLVAYVECRPIDDESMIRATIQTTEDSLADNVDVFQEVLDGIEVDGGSADDDDGPLGPDDEQEA